MKAPSLLSSVRGSTGTVCDRLARGVSPTLSESRKARWHWCPPIGGAGVKARKLTAEDKKAVKAALRPASPRPQYDPWAKPAKRKAAPRPAKVAAPRKAAPRAKVSTPRPAVAKVAPRAARAPRPVDTNTHGFGLAAPRRAKLTTPRPAELVCVGFCASGALYALAK